MILIITLTSYGCLHVFISTPVDKLDQQADEVDVITEQKKVRTQYTKQLDASNSTAIANIYHVL